MRCYNFLVRLPKERPQEPRGCFVFFLVKWEGQCNRSTIADLEQGCKWNLHSKSPHTSVKTMNWPPQIHFTVDGQGKGPSLVMGRNKEFWQQQKKKGEWEGMNITKNDTSAYQNYSETWRGEYSFLGGVLPSLVLVTFTELAPHWPCWNSTSFFRDILHCW